MSAARGAVEALRVLYATDGSADARAAGEWLSRFPLPAASEMSRLCGNGARRSGFTTNGAISPPLETVQAVSSSRKEVHERGT